MNWEGRLAVISFSCCLLWVVSPQLLFDMKVVPINTDKDGNALTIKACYFKNAAYSTLTQWGGVNSHFPVTGVMEIDETDSLEYM